MWPRQWRPHDRPGARRRAPRTAWGRRSVHPILRRRSPPTRAEPPSCALLLGGGLLGRCLLRGGGRLVLALEHLVEASLGGFFVDVERERELGHEDLTGPGQHALLAGRETLVGLADREITHHLGDLIDVTALQLL